MTATAPAAYDSVAAEDAPTGVLLWPVRHPQYAPNFTLASVEVVTNEVRSYVLWTYQSGKTRVFDLGEQVIVRTEA